MNGLIEVICEAIRITKKRRAAKVKSQRYYKIALAFNDEHTHTSMHGKWMCPTCNQVHDCTTCSVMDGLHFPKCCGFTDGARLFYNDHATTGRTTP